ncbi:MAG: FHA domain-containing protein [Spirochaetes bacterium]|nr:FHA domain-containing protein [Spirochaetota bacterium]
MTGTDTFHLDDNRKIHSAGILNRKGILLILSENFLGKSFVLDKKVSIVGRDESCDIVINDPLISKKHCSITLTDEGHYHIEDLDSTNSTFLNGKLLKKPGHISYGDRIIIGDTILRFFHEEKFESK